MNERTTLIRGSTRQLLECHHGAEMQLQAARDKRKTTPTTSVTDTLPSIYGNNSVVHVVLALRKRFIAQQFIAPRERGRH